MIMVLPGMFLSISVSDKSLPPFVLSVPISWGEIEVLKVLVTFCLPRFLGLERSFDAATAASTSNGPRSGAMSQENGYGLQQQSKPSPFTQFSNQQPYSYN